MGSNDRFESIKRIKFCFIVTTRYGTWRTVHAYVAYTRLSFARVRIVCLLSRRIYFQTLTHTETRLSQLPPFLSHGRVRARANARLTRVARFTRRARRRVPAQNTSERGASRSIVPPQTELLCRGTPVAFVEGITPTIHTRPTDSRSMMIFPVWSPARAHTCTWMFARLCVCTIAFTFLVDHSPFDGPTGGPCSIFFLVPLFYIFAFLGFPRCFVRFTCMYKVFVKQLITGNNN